MTRTAMKYSPDALVADKAYYSEKGWLDSKYYYKVGLGPVHSVLGALIDKLIHGMIVRGK